MSSDRFGKNLIGSDRFGPDRIGSDRFGSDRIGSDRFGSDRIGSDRIDSDRFDSDRSLLMYYIPHVDIGIHCYRTTGTYPCIVLLLDYVYKVLDGGRMTYCYYQGKPTVVRLPVCYWYCYILLGR